MEMIDHLQEIINAEIGILNLQSLFEMLPYFAASGHLQGLTGKFGQIC